MEKFLSPKTPELSVNKRGPPNFLKEVSEMTVTEVFSMDLLREFHCDKLTRENPGSNPLSGRCPNVQGNSPAQKPSVTKTRGAPRIYKEINEMTDIDAFSEDLLREFHRDKLTRPAFEEENKTRKFCKPQDIARYLEKQARLLSEKYGKTLELTPYQTGKRASRPSAIERIVEIRSALFSHDKADDSSIKIAAWEGANEDKSAPNEDFDVYNNKSGYQKLKCINEQLNCENGNLKAENQKMKKKLGKYLAVEKQLLSFLKQQYIA